MKKQEWGVSMSIRFDNFVMVYCKSKSERNVVFINIYFKSVRDKSYYMIDDLCKLLCNVGYDCEIEWYQGHKLLHIIFKEKEKLELQLSKYAYNYYYKTIALEIKDLLLEYLYGEYFNVALFDCFVPQWFLSLNVSYSLLDFSETMHNDTYQGCVFYRKRERHEVKEMLRKSLEIAKIKRRGKTIKIFNNAINNPYIVWLDVDMYMDCVEEICKELNIDYVLA